MDDDLRTTKRHRTVISDELPIADESLTPATVSFPSQRKRPRRVAVLLGGQSAEREISLQSGAAVVEALQEAGHLVSVVDPLHCDLNCFAWSTVEMVFIALHGTHGEDGTIQRQLDALEVVYTSSGAVASELAFHKRLAKSRFVTAGLATPEYRVFDRKADGSKIFDLAEDVGFPLVVKPEAQGSSLGISILSERTELPAAVERARKLDNMVLLERAIPGQEWTVPVLDDFALPPIHIRTPHQFFDFNAKYVDEQTEYEVITDSRDVVARAVSKLALSACRQLGCRGISRVDLRVDAAGKAWLLEVNTVPGMTTHSLVPKSAGAIGWSLSRLCEEILASALSSQVTSTLKRA